MKTALMRETAAELEQALNPRALERFRARLDGPLAVVASGGSFTAAVLWARLHETAGHPAWAMTPYSFAERTLPAGTRVALLSVGGNHHDILRTARLARDRGYDLRAVTGRGDSPLAREVMRHVSPDDLLVTPESRHADGLIAVHGTVVFSVLAAHLYTSAGPWAPCFDAGGVALRTSPPSFVVAFGAGPGEPAAVDFANKCQESGLAPAWHTDLRHFAHGQWMSLHADPDGLLLVAFASRSQRPYLERFAAVLPSSITLRPIVVDTDGTEAALSLLSRSMRSFETLVALGRGAPTLEDVPPWCRTLYELEP